MPCSLRTHSRSSLTAVSRVPRFTTRTNHTEMKTQNRISICSYYTPGSGLFSGSCTDDSVIDVYIYTWKHRDGYTDVYTLRSGSKYHWNFLLCIAMIQILILYIISNVLACSFYIYKYRYKTEKAYVYNSYLIGCRRRSHFWLAVV